MSITQQADLHNYPLCSSTHGGNGSRCMCTPACCMARLTLVLQGLAISMFLCAIAANSFYGGGIIIRTYDWETFWNSLPWLLGSLGTVGLDVTIYLQVCAMSSPCRSYYFVTFMRGLWCCFTQVLAGLHSSADARPGAVICVELRGSGTDIAMVQYLVYQRRRTDKEKADEQLLNGDQEEA